MVRRTGGQAGQNYQESPKREENARRYRPIGNEYEDKYYDVIVFFGMVSALLALLSRYKSPAWASLFWFLISFCTLEERPGLVERRKQLVTLIVLSIGSLVMAYGSDSSPIEIPFMED